MQCLPDNLKHRIYYHPTDQGVEKRVKARLEEIRRLKAKISASRNHEPDNQD
jgi:putative ATPase